MFWFSRKTLRGPSTAPREAPHKPTRIVADGAALQAARGRGALAERLGGRRPLPRRRRSAAGRLVRDRRAAAERDRRAAHGPRAQRRDPGRADPLPPPARL